MHQRGWVILIGKSASEAQMESTVCVGDGGEGGGAGWQVNHIKKKNSNI